MKTRNVIFILGLFCSTVLFGSEDFNINENDPGSTNEPSDPEQKGTDSKTHDEIMRDHDHDQLPEKPVGNKEKNSNHKFDNKSSDKKIVLHEPDGPASSSSTSQKSAHESESQTEKLAVKKADSEVDDEFDQGLQDQDPKLSPREEENKELLDFVEDQLKGKFSESQIKIVKEVTDSYLEKLRKKLLRRAMKKFLRNMVKMIFKEVRSAEKINGAVTDRDVWVICKKEYAKELSRLDAAKKKYISAKRSKRIKKLNSKK